MLTGARVDPNQHIAMDIRSADVVEDEFQKPCSLSLLDEDNTAWLITSLIVHVEPLMKLQDLGAQIEVVEIGFPEVVALHKSGGILELLDLGIKLFNVYAGPIEFVVLELFPLLEFACLLVCKSE